jgi:hypothetical protein
VEHLMSIFKIGNSVGAPPPWSHNMDLTVNWH